VRDTVENFIASIMLSIRQAFRPFDLVEIEGDIDKVVRLTSRATILLSVDGNMIRVPNATVFKSRIVNYTRNSERRFTFSIDIDPTADMAGLRDRAQEKLAALPFVLKDPASAVWIDEKDGSHVELCFAAWIDQNETSFNRARGEAIRILRAMVQDERALRPPPISRVYAMDDREAAMNHTEIAAHDLTDDAIADLSITDSDALNRLAQTERENADARDLLRRNPATE
jgi:small-conductance mechanosensitive channel